MSHDMRRLQILSDTYIAFGCCAVEKEETMRYDVIIISLLRSRFQRRLSASVMRRDHHRIAP